MESASFGGGRFIGVSATLVAPDKGTLPGREILPEKGDVVTTSQPSAGSGMHELSSINGDLRAEFVFEQKVFSPYYYLTDHLGSVRAIVNQEGVVQERNDYYPYGGRWNAGQISNNRYRYNGKEDQAFVDSPYLDYGARMYDPNLGRWFNVDPLAEKYPATSPYVFCLNNPLKFFNPDGKKVFFAPGVSDEFKEKFAATVQYMNERGTSGDIAKLEASEQVYYIGETFIDGESSKEQSNALDRQRIQFIGILTQPIKPMREFGYRRQPF